jgi:hypothetical protein
LSNALFFQREPWRLRTALSLSLLAHTLLLSIAIAGQTFGLPGLNFPWKERRLGADDLQIMLAPARPVTPGSADGLAQAKMVQPALTPFDEPAVARQATPMPMPSPPVGQSETATATVSMPPPTPAPAPATAVAPLAPVVTARKQPDVQSPTAAETRPASAPDTATQRPPPAGQSDLPVPSIGANQVQERALEQAKLEQSKLEQARLELERQSTERLRQAELTTNAQREANRQEQLRQEMARAEQIARRDAARLEAERSEQARQETMRREALQKERASQDEKARQEMARHELERAEAARLEAARLEAGRREARQEQSRQAQLEAARQAQLETARQDAIRQEAARRDAANQEAARQAQERKEPARQEQISQEKVSQEKVRQEQAQRERAEQEEKRMERLRAIGKQLDQEAAQRNAAPDRPASALAPTVSSLRRGWVYGRADPNPDLVLYAEAMSRKIEMNMTMDMAREAVKQPHAQPIVTVAIRADGSVEKVTFVVSSGVPAIDAAIRKIVASQAPYAAFTPAMARQYDVIEIRRTWTFDIAIRLQ